MAEYVVVVIAQGADHTGRPATQAVAPSVGASAVMQMLSETALTALAKIVADWQPAAAKSAPQNVMPGADQLWPFILTFLPVAPPTPSPSPMAVPVAVMPEAPASISSRSVIAESGAAPPRPAFPDQPPVRPRMPGWLVAHTRRQAAIVGRNARPAQAGRVRARGGNRPARRPQAPKPAVRRAVVWMAVR